MDRLIPLSEIDDAREFWSGTRIRLFNVGLNVSDKSHDYYDYMLVEIPWEPSLMLATNVTMGAGRNKAGNTMCSVKTLEGVDRFVVTGAALKFSFGTVDTYLLQFDEA